MKGIILTMKGEWDAALSVFESAIAVSMPSEMVNEYKAPIFLNQGKLDESLAASLAAFPSVMMFEDRAKIYLAMAEARPDEAHRYKESAVATWKELFKEPARSNLS